MVLVSNLLNEGLLCTIITDKVMICTKELHKLFVTCHKSRTMRKQTKLSDSKFGNTKGNNIIYRV